MNTKQSNMAHGNAPVYYTYPNTNNDSEEELLSWIDEYIKDGATEISGLFTGELYLSNVCVGVWVNENDSRATKVRVKDFILIPYNDGWLYTRLEDSEIANCNDAMVKLNTIQYWYG